MDEQSGRTHWPKLWLGALVSLVLGLGTHVIMLSCLHVLFPSDPPTTGVLVFANRVLVVLAALLLYERSDLAHGPLAAPWKVLLCFGLFTTMTELLLRYPLMNGFVTTAWQYWFLKAVPRLVPWFVLACLVVLAGMRCRKPWQKATVAVAGAGVVFLLVEPMATMAYAPVLTKFAYLGHDDVYPFPYGWQVTSAAFITYAEPVAACLVAASLVWKRLPARPLWKVLCFALLVVMLRGSALSPLAYAVKHADRFWAALVSDGQFTVESVALGLLTGLTWMVARSHALQRTPSASLGLLR